MACSFSSSSFWRAITARIIFLSSSVRWLKSGMSGIEAGTEARGPPWGPTEAAMILPPPSLRCVSYWRYGLRLRSALPCSVSCLRVPTTELLSPFVRCLHPLPTSILYLALFSSLPHPPTPPHPTPRLPASPLHLRLREAHLLYATRLLELRLSRSSLVSEMMDNSEGALCVFSLSCFQDLSFRTLHASSKQLERAQNESGVAREKKKESGASFKPESRLILREMDKSQTRETAVCHSFSLSHRSTGAPGVLCARWRISEQ